MLWLALRVLVCLLTVSTLILSVVNLAAPGNIKLSPFGTQFECVFIMYVHTKSLIPQYN